MSGSETGELLVMQPDAAVKQVQLVGDAEHRLRIEASRLVRTDFPEAQFTDAE
jgi:hypothetical protein